MCTPRLVTDVAHATNIAGSQAAPTARSQRPGSPRPCSARVSGWGEHTSGCAPCTRPGRQSPGPQHCPRRRHFPEKRTWAALSGKVAKAASAASDTATDVQRRGTFLFLLRTKLRSFAQKQNNLPALIDASWEPLCHLLLPRPPRQARGRRRQAGHSACWALTVSAEQSGRRDKHAFGPSRNDTVASR